MAAKDRHKDGRKELESPEVPCPQGVSPATRSLVRYVGSAGALAVAFGVGAALTPAVGVAAASPSDTQSVSASTKSKTETKTEPQSEKKSHQDGDSAPSAENDADTDTGTVGKSASKDDAADDRAADDSDSSTADGATPSTKSEKKKPAKDHAVRYEKSTRDDQTDPKGTKDKGPSARADVPVVNKVATSTAAPEPAVQEKTHSTVDMVAAPVSVAVPESPTSTESTTPTTSSTVPTLTSLSSAPVTPAAPSVPAAPLTLWSIIASMGEQLRHTFSNSTPTLKYDAQHNTSVEGTDAITGAVEVDDDDVTGFTATQGAHGRVTINADGVFVYDPDDDYTGPDQFTVTVTDAGDFHVHGLLGFLRPDGGHVASKVVGVSVGDTAELEALAAVGGSTPTPTTAPNLTPSSTSVLVNWAKPNQGGSPITRFSIRYRTTGGTWALAPDASASATSATITGLVKNTDYEIAVRASNALGNSAWSASKLTRTTNVVDPTPPVNPGTTPAPMSVPDVTPSSTSVLVKWTKPNQGGSPITRFSLRYRTTNGTWTLAPDAPATATSATITGLVKNTDYEIAVRASNALGNSAWSASKLTHTGSVVPNPDPGQPPAAGVLWQDKFDSAPTGQLTKATGDALFGPTAAGTNGDTYQYGSILVDPAGGKFLRNKIPAGGLGAFVVSPVLSQPTDHAILSYDIRFDDNFDWRWGGKMPGLVGVAPGHGIYEPTSGNVNRDVGFSTRLMWHGRGDDGTRPFQSKLGPIPTGSDSDVVTYIYAKNPSQGFSGYGWHTSLGTDLERGQWHRVTMEVKLNTIGKSDGSFKVSIDNVVRYSATNWEYRSDPGVEIQAVLYDIHRGGGTTPPSWVSNRDGFIDVRNMTVNQL